MHDLECPYCDAELEVCHDDGFGYDEGKAHEMECSDCGKTFTFHTSISFHYSPEKADCLNGSPHPFREWQRLWEDDGKRTEHRRCLTCEKEERRVVPVISENAPMEARPDGASIQQGSL